MKKLQTLFFLLFLFLSTPTVFSQSIYSSPKWSLGIQANPFLVRVPVPSATYPIPTEVQLQSLIGLSGEKFLNDRLGIRAHLMYQYIEWLLITPNVSIFISEEDRTILNRQGLTEIGFTLRFYQQNLKAKTRAFVELGLGGMLLLHGDISVPFHSDPELAKQIETNTMSYWYTSALLGGGLQLRLANRWGIESALFGRIPMQEASSVHYGLKLGVNYLLK